MLACPPTQLLACLLACWHVCPPTRPPACPPHRPLPSALALPIGLCARSAALCPLPSALCPLPSILCPLPSAPCSVPCALCPPPSAHWPLAAACWPLPYGLCLLASVRCLPEGLCPMASARWPHGGALTPNCPPPPAACPNFASVLFEHKTSHSRGPGHAARGEQGVLLVQSWVFGPPQPHAAAGHFGPVDCSSC